MVSANKEMAVYCFDTLVSHYNNEETPPPAFEEGNHPLFVTWKKIVNGGEPRLRGCIGTLEARRLISGFKDYALTSALRDRRFPPIQPKELPFLQCTVSVLTDYEDAEDYLDWEVGKHGMIIEFTEPETNTRRSATYLPEVPAHEGWTKIEAIDSLVRKAGYNGVITEAVRRRIHLTRYQSTLFTMHYSEYLSYVKATRGVVSGINGTNKPAVAEVVPKRIMQMEKAIKNRDFTSFTKLTCADSNQFHAVCMDTSPPIFYMNDTSHRIISLAEKWNRCVGTPEIAYTFDAGPNAVLIARNRKVAVELLQGLLYCFPPKPDTDMKSYVLGDTSIVKEAGLEGGEVPQEIKDKIGSQDQKGEVSYFICSRPGKGPVVVPDQTQALLHPQTGLPK